MFKHYLNFLDLPKIGKIQVSEPFGFDGQTHKIIQEDGRYGRDIIIANETIKLRFFRDNFEFIDKPQVSIDGTIFSHASHGFDYLVYLFENNGWESEVEYIIEKDNNSFTNGLIDFFTANIKEHEIEFSIIQNTNRELVKRREDIYINAFSDKDLDGNTIEPCSTSNILLKAKPIFRESKFKSAFEEGYTAVNVANSGDTTQFRYFSPFQVVLKDELQNTLSFFEPISESDGGDFRLFQANERTTNFKIRIPKQNYNLSYNEYAGANGFGDFSFIIKWGFDYLTANEYHFFDYTLNISGQVINFNSDYEFNIPLIEKGASVWLFYYSKARKSDIGVLGSVDAIFGIGNFIDDRILTISGTSTALDSVIKGVRLIDLLKHNVKSISGLNLESEMYDVTGKYYDNFAFNGKLIAQIDDKPFNNKFKDLINIPKELNADYQINTNKVEILPYEYFYKNIEIDSLIEIPNNEEDYPEFNKRYFLKSIEYGYKKSSFEKTNTERDSIDDVHTFSQYLYPSKKTDGILKIDIEHIRSAFLIEEQRTKIIRDKKVLENDDDLFLIDVMPLDSNSRNSFVTLLQYFEGKLLSDGTFDWTLLGFNIGDILIINGISVSVISYEALVLTTSGSFGTGLGFFTIDYPLSNVSFVNRTNEGFSIINGILNPENYSNLNYHIKRNLLTYESYLATAGKYLPNKSIQNTVFRVNDKLETQLDLEIDLVKDKGDIVINDIASKKILNPIIHNVTVFCDFDRVTEIFDKIQSIKGFFRIKTIKNKIIKGYPIDANFEWTTNKLTLKLEERFEGDYLTIYKVDSVIFINEVGYEIKIGLNRYEINNNFVCLYDNSNILICNPISFEKVKINNILYTDLILFSNAIASILI